MPFRFVFPSAARPNIVAISRSKRGYYYSARGHLGQLISVFPKDRLVVVRFGRSEDGVDSWDKVIETVAAEAR